MKKIGMGCLACLLAGVIGWGALVANPPSRYQKQVGEMVSRRQKAYQATQQLALDRNKNSFQDSMFAPYWGRRGHEFKENSQPAGLLKGMKEFASQAAGSDRHIAQCLDEKDPKLAGAVADFEQVYAHLHELLARTEYLIAPEEPSEAGMTFPNFLALRELEQSLSGYTEVMVAGGRSDQAQAAALDGLRLAEQLNEQSVTTTEHLSRRLALQDMALATCEFVVTHPRSALNSDALKAFAQTLQKSCVAANSLAEVREGDLFVLSQWSQSARPEFIQQMGNVNELWAIAVNHIPGLYERELRIYQNQLFEQTLISHSEPEAERERFGWKKWLTGRVSYLLGDSSTPDLHFQALEIRNGLDHLLVHVLLFRSVKGVWPKVLAQLDEVHYRPLAGFQLDQVQLETGPQGELRLAYGKGLPAGLVDRFRGWPEAWIADGDQLTLTLREP